MNTLKSNTQAQPVETVNGVQIRPIKEISTGMKIAFRDLSMQDADGDLERLAGPGEIAEVGEGPDKDGDWSVSFPASGCWVFVGPEVLRAHAAEIISDLEPDSALLSTAWGAAYDGNQEDKEAFTTILPAIREVVKGITPDCDAYSYVSHGEDTGEDGRPASIVVCVEQDHLVGAPPEDPQRAFETDHSDDYAYFIYPMAIGTPRDIVAVLRRDLESVGLL